MTSHKLYNDVKNYKDLDHFETPYVVKFHKHYLLAPTQASVNAGCLDRGHQFCKRGDIKSVSERAWIEMAYARFVRHSAARLHIRAPKLGRAYR